MNKLTRNAEIENGCDKVAMVVTLIVLVAIFFGVNW